VAEHDIGPNPADRSADRGAFGEAAEELAVGQVEDLDPGEPELGGRLFLFPAAGRHQRSQIGVGVPGALRSVREHEEMGSGARRRPLGQGAAAPELDVVGVGADRECPRRCREVSRGT
jgi:hypothetical protein